MSERVWVVLNLGGGPVLPTVGASRAHSIAAYEALFVGDEVYATHKREGRVLAVRATLTLEQPKSPRRKP